MGNAFSRKGYAAWLCAVLLACCLVAGVPGVQVAASDDVANPGPSGKFTQITMMQSWATMGTGM